MVSARLARGGGGAEGGEDLLDGGAEAHLEQLVGLVEDERLQPGEEAQQALLARQRLSRGCVGGGNGQKGVYSNAKLVQWRW